MAHCLSSARARVRKQFFLNHLAKFVETLQGCSLHEALLKVFKELDSLKKSGCHGDQKIILQKKSEKSSFGMKHLLVNVYKVCSNKNPRVKIDRAQGGH
jgi:CRISPR/Cas system-associated exonuclease Cas4 (RecB family)